jgi:SAM-dependent methyltransferase
MLSVDLARRLLRCPGCLRSEWEEHARALRCPCGREAAVQDGVLQLDPVADDAVAVCYESLGGLRFAEASFRESPQIALTTRAYRRHLSELLRVRSGALADLGCGDGRFSLWALEHGFEAVVALDRTFASLARLREAAERRGLRGLLPVQASFTSRALVPGAFGAALAIEAFTYLDAEYASGLALLRELLSDGGRGVVSEFCRSGKLLSDVVALNLENMSKIAAEGRRIEKSSDARLVQRLFTIEELVSECEAARLAVLERRSVSPVGMLFQYAWTFTSYPLRPPLDEPLERLLQTLDDQSAGVSDFARNIVLLVEKKG